MGWDSGMKIPPWLSISLMPTVGTILFVLGILGLILSLLYTFMWSRRQPVDQTRGVHRPPAPDDRYY